jgi:hypothetical protein
MILAIAGLLVSMSATYTTFFRYLVLAAVVVLLAPYAGCHILTTPPSDTFDDVHNQPRSSTPSLKSPDVVDNSNHSGAARPVTEKPAYLRTALQSQ